MKRKIRIHHAEKKLATCSVYGKEKGEYRWKNMKIGFIRHFFNMQATLKGKIPFFFLYVPNKIIHFKSMLWVIVFFGLFFACLEILILLRLISIRSWMHCVNRNEMKWLTKLNFTHSVKFILPFHIIWIIYSHFMSHIYMRHKFTVRNLLNSIMMSTILFNGNWIECYPLLCPQNLMNCAHVLYGYTQVLRI